MLMTIPKFMENENWFYEDNDNPIKKEYDIQCIRLTDIAPMEAVKSYLDYYVPLFEYELGFVPEFVYEEYRKHIARLETNK